VHDPLEVPQRLIAIEEDGLDRRRSGRSVQLTRTTLPNFPPAANRS
jgi:hypothetical protein